MSLTWISAPGKRLIGPRRPVLMALVLVVLGAGCASHQAPAGTGAAVVRVTENDFHISAPKSLSQGNLVLRVSNKGPDSHEFIVVRNGGSLPLRADGITVDEDALQGVIVGGLEPAEVGSVRDLRLHLASGHYQFFCNMAGHYMAGMHGEIVVR